MLHCFAIELCYVYACIAFVNLLILYCNKVFEIASHLKLTRYSPGEFMISSDGTAHPRCVVYMEASQLAFLS